MNPLYMPEIPELNTTEKIILDIVNEPFHSVQDKVHLICHYRKKMNNEVFKFFLDQIKFVEQLKETMQMAMEFKGKTN